MDIINAIKNSSTLMSVILNHLNTGVFIIDERYRLTSFNSHFTHSVTRSFIKRTNHLCNEMIGCVYAATPEKMLGDTTFCSECDLMRAVDIALKDNVATAEQTLVRENIIEDKTVRKYYRYSCKPLVIEGYRLALLMIDDITALEKQRAELLEQNAIIHRLNDKFHQDLVLAKKVQTSIIPKAPVILNNYRIDFMYFPLEEIGGDMFDIIKIDEDKLGIFMCDVIGHGLPAALVTTMVKALLATYRNKLESPKKLMISLNKQLVKMVGEPYMTAFYGVLDTNKHTFNFVRAGHPFPWKLDGGIQTFGHHSNPMIGIDEDMIYEEELVHLKSESKIMLYTDGLLEAGTDDGHYEKRLIEFLDDNPNVSGNKLLSLMKDDLISNVVYDKHMDDICILLIEHIPDKNIKTLSEQFIS